MKVKRLNDNECRVIRIKEDAIRELIYETIIEKGKDFFDLLDITRVSFEICFDMDARDLICVVHNRTYPLNKEVDFDQIANILIKQQNRCFHPKDTLL